MQGHIIPSMTIIRQICVETDNQLILNDFFRFSTNYLEDQNEESQHSEPKVANIIDISSFRRQAETSNKIPPGGDIDTIMLAEILAFSFARLKKKSKGGFNAHSLLITAEAVSMTYCALTPVTSHQGQAQLAQALLPVLEETLADYGVAPLHHEKLTHLSRQIAYLYYRCLHQFPAQLDLHSTP